ncbi:MAG: serine protease, partial [Planctomycetes bacterium]|nr:serine protease [Planctomycetota bacterium]
MRAASAILRQAGRALLAALSLGAVVHAQEARELTLEEVERAFFRVAEAVRPSVVSVSARLAVPLVGGEPGVSTPGGEEATYDVYMSGVLTGPDGEVVTLRRGLGGARLIQVTLADGRVLAARHVATDDLTAIALMRILDPPQDLRPIRPSTREVRPGALIVAVGNPYGFANSVAYGNVSGVERVVGSHAYTGLLQITAPINPGDQGGLVADARGEAIGLVASTYRRALSSPLSAEALGRMVEQQVDTLLRRFLREGPLALGSA